jgi:DNA (cytosine-5)-methyltransferase 1
MRVADNTEVRFNVLSLCSGGSGLELGLGLVLGRTRTVCYVEREAFAAACLATRMQDGLLDEAPLWTDVTSYDGKPWRGVVDIVSAGWPCTPFSTMGKRKGTEDEHFIWPHIADIIRDTDPLLVFGENVPQHLDVGFRDVRSDLRGMGYEVEAGVFTAAEIGLPHKRARMFALAYPSGQHARLRELGPLWRASLGGRDGGLRRPDGEGGGADGVPCPPRVDEQQVWRRLLADSPWLKPAFCEPADELADGLGKPVLAHGGRQIRLLGNGVVPLVAAYAFQVLLHKACLMQGVAQKAP